MGEIRAGQRVGFLHYVEGKGTVLGPGEVVDQAEGFAPGHWNVKYLDDAGQEVVRVVHGSYLTNSDHWLNRPLGGS